MMFALYLHHILIHVPIVLPWLLAIIGTYWIARQTSELERLLRYIGDFCAVVTDVTMVAGLLVDFTRTGAMATYTDHQYLGITTAMLANVASVSVEVGLRTGKTSVAKYGALMWWVVGFASVGASHWGASLTHGDVIMF